MPQTRVRFIEQEYNSGPYCALFVSPPPILCLFTFLPFGFCFWAFTVSEQSRVERVMNVPLGGWQSCLKHSRGEKERSARRFFGHLTPFRGLRGGGGGGSGSSSSSEK